MLKTCLAMVSITVLTCIALLLGHDGTLLSTAIAILAGLGGYAYAKHE